MNLQEQLAYFIGIAFEYEQEFLAEFFIDADELLEVYMASERTYITYLHRSGNTMSTTINTDDFLNWCEQTY